MATSVYWITFHHVQQLPPHRLPFWTAKTTPAPPKYTTGQNKNIFSSVIAGQTSVSLLDSAFTQQQIASDKGGAGGGGK